MPVDVVRAQVIIPATSNIPEDAVNNVFHFRWDAAGQFIVGDAQEVTDRLLNAYNPVTGTGPGDYISGKYAPNNATIKVYRLSDPSPRPPILTVTGVNLGTAKIDQPLPEEVALCLSFHGGPEAGAIAARRRGRTYFGPFTEFVLGQRADGTVAPVAALINDVAAFGTHLMADNTTDLSWAVYSPTDAQTYTIVGGYVDNAFDTQRRRGRAPSTRTAW
jgi:hypothetical protein